MFPFFKRGAEAALAVKTGGESHLFDGNPACAQEKFCGVDTGGDQILMRRKSGLLRKNPCKMV